MKDAIILPSKSLSQFGREFGREWVINYITMWLIEFNDYITVKRKMNDAQIVDTATSIYDEYRLKVTDITLFFKRCKQEYYEPSFESISGAKIMRWLKMYFDERCDAAETVSTNEHKGTSMTKDKIDPKIVEELFKGVGEEKIEHKHPTSGLGGRFAKELAKQTPYSKEFYAAQLKKTEAKSMKRKKKKTKCPHCEEQCLQEELDAYQGLCVECSPNKNPLQGKFKRKPKKK